MSKLDFLDGIVQEMECRRRPLLAEKEALLKAASRIAEIDQLVADIDEEIEQMSAKADRVRPPAPKVDKVK